MGTYRFLLAIAVALSHMGVRFAGVHNPGVVAVISFFLISGYVMTALVRSYYSEYSKVPLFYLDRLVRIFPQYLFFMAMTILGYSFFDFASPYLSNVSFMGLLANLLVVPLDFYMYSKTIAGCMLIPQAWSLGLELMFYLLFPYILISGKRTVWMILSLLIWLFAAFGVVDTDVWGYRLLPGTLFIFLLGSCIFDEKKPSFKHPSVIMLTLLLVGAVSLLAANKLDVPYNMEVLLGLLFGVSAVFILARCKRNNWDNMLGNLSYGLFLSHFLVIWIFEKWDFSRGSVGIMLMLVVSVILAYFGYVAVEHPVLKWRRGLRRGLS